MTCFLDNIPGDCIRNPTSATHFMWLQPVDGQVSVYFENFVLAVTTNALRVIEVGSEVFDPALYLPRQDVCAELKENGRTAHCALKGDGTYFDLVNAEGQALVARAAWTYEAPFKTVARLEGRIAFDQARFTFETAPL